MIEFVLQWNESHMEKRITISVELENLAKKNITLVEHADFVFLSKDYAQLMGWMTKEIAIQNLRHFVKKKFVENYVQYNFTLNIRCIKFHFFVSSYCKIEIDLSMGK